jgi:hypothetical protein
MRAAPSKENGHLGIELRKAVPHGRRLVFAAATAGRLRLPARIRRRRPADGDLRFPPLTACARPGAAGMTRQRLATGRRGDERPRTRDSHHYHGSGAAAPGAVITARAAAVSSGIHGSVLRISLSSQWRRPRGAALEPVKTKVTPDTICGSVANTILMSARPTHDGTVQRHRPIAIWCMRGSPRRRVPASRRRIGCRSTRHQVEEYLLPIIFRMGRGDEQATVVKLRSDLRRQSSRSSGANPSRVIAMSAVTTY